MRHRRRARAGRLWRRSQRALGQSRRQGHAEPLAESVTQPVTIREVNQYQGTYTVQDGLITAADVQQTG